MKLRHIAFGAQNTKEKYVLKAQQQCLFPEIVKIVHRTCEQLNIGAVLATPHRMKCSRLMDNRFVLATEWSVNINGVLSG